MQTARVLKGFEQYLIREERGKATIQKYVRDAGEFLSWLETRELTKEQAVAWKKQLAGQHMSPMTVNGKLAAINRLFLFLGKPDCRVKYLKLQRKLFRNTERELTREEFARLVETARSTGRERLALLMESICATGIRVSEVKYLTVEAAQAGCAEISLKGKIRTILIPGKLSRKLLKYARKQKNRFRRDFSHQKRKRPDPSPDLGGDEGAVRCGACRAFEGISPQPATPVCPHIL